MVPTTDHAWYDQKQFFSLTHKNVTFNTLDRYLPFASLSPASWCMCWPHKLWPIECYIAIIFSGSSSWLKLKYCSLSFALPRDLVVWLYFIQLFVAARSERCSTIPRVHFLVPLDIGYKLIMKTHKSTPPMFVVLGHYSRSRHRNMALLSRWLSHAAVLGLPYTLPAIRTALLSCHFITATSDGFLTIISDVPLPCFWSFLLSDIFKLKSAEIMFITMGPVPRSPFSFGVFSTLTEVKYLSKYRRVPLGRDCGIQVTAFPPIPSCWLLNAFRPL